MEAAPRTYRNLLDAAYGALAATGHAGDTILIGETAPKGVRAVGPTRAIQTLHFLRQLFCLDDRYRPLRGAAASERGCPATARQSALFAAAHPALFAASGFADHPYQFDAPPSVVPANRDYATISALPRLAHTLARVLAAYHHPRAGGMPLYLTEFGYKTRPPNPTGVTLAQQAAYLDQAEYIAYSDPAVSALSQFLLVDVAPHRGRNGSLWGDGATLQTGLEFTDGRPKPALPAYELPLFLPRPTIRRGQRLRVWGRVRPAAGAGARVAIQFRAGGRGSFTTLAVVSADHGRRFIDTRLRVPGSGELRLAWTPPAGPILFSRTAEVRLR